ncbi:lipopolysaccharide cholinephosphotransferase [Paenibacillus polysaccharolyticus]|uniref:Lipopolysaccharide cholinephosphotransferase n=1 Tax=Paenibacillus polysaccharolyticus TaxID=582692 RepID=A0A1G5KDU3_9BACL|nr:LicD family protein [Paenibacillus polysaccharolyticus]SCY98149.1 lipopolysaccharide cholinephosphotransferase [Paenibacillus polysaccharolyticus]
MNKLNDLQVIELDILKEFARVAKREGLTWFSMFGTLLGAVRHDGFIPWDDDVDIALPRREYERLRLSQHWFSEPYFLQTPQNDPAAASHFIRLRRSDTAVLVNFPNGYTRGGHMGAYIDILPLDDMPNGRVARDVQDTVLQMQKQMYASAALDECEGAEISEGKEYFCYGSGGISGQYDVLAERYERFCSKYSNQLYYALPVLGGEYGRRVYDKKWFSESVEMDFEDLKIPVPVGYKETLITSYPGGLYEPDLKDRTSKMGKSTVIDLGRPYKDYVRRYTDMLNGIEDKKVFIFGAGDSLRIWMERYSEDLNVVCAFDNRKDAWGSYAYGVPIHSPIELPGLLDENSRLIIASVYHQEIAQQLEEMRIQEYFVFIDGLKYSSC